MPGTLTFSVVNWKESDAECTFTVVNSGFGYTTQLQNKYYHTSFGLFILTNNTFFFDSSYGSDHPPDRGHRK